MGPRFCDPSKKRNEEIDKEYRMDYFIKLNVYKIYKDNIK